MKFTYDKAERLETVTDLTVSPNRPLKTFAYGTSEAANERTNGRLLTGTRYTYQLVNGVSFIEKVDETYAYAGPGGRTTSRTTQLSAWTSLNPVFAAAEGFTQSWTYDDLGNVKTIGYPDCFTGSCQNLDSARTVTNTYANGWLTSVAGSGGAVYASAIAYHSNGMLKKITRGNGVSLDIGLAPDSMSRPASFSTSGAGTSNWISGNYAYDGAGNVTAIGNSRFTYDHVSRLKTAEILVESGTGLPFRDGFETGDLRCWAPGSCMTGSEDFNQTFTYDPFGNLKEVVGDQGRNTPTSSATNRLTEATYDVAGNLLTWNGDTYEYDPLGTMTRRCPSGCVAGAPDWRYIYTADDERLFALQVTQGAGFGNVWTLRDLGGSTLREYDATATWAARDYIYRDGQLLASNAPGEGDRHFHLDHLGTPRLITNAAGAKVAYHSYLPFGEEATPVAQDAERRKFTGHERDTLGTTSANDDRDNMHARHFSPLTGRFLSTDRVPGRPGVPQSWNRYAYALGNPVKYVDPDGLDTTTTYTSGETFTSWNDPIWASVFGGAVAVGAVVAASYGTVAAVETVEAGASALAFRIAATSAARGVLVRYAPVAASPALQKVINQLYKPADRWVGGTAGALRIEAETGVMLSRSGTGHAQAGLERLGNLGRVLQTGGLDARDVGIAMKLQFDLKTALELALTKLGYSSQEISQIIASGKLPSPK